MADKNKEEPYWSRIVLRWVKCAQLNAGHDNIDLAACYYNFRCKIKDYYDLQEKTIVEFLRVKFPDFELQLGKENEVPASDAIYVFSLMLYFSCVRHSIPYFQNIGKEFDVAYQHSMKAFLNSFVSENDNKIVINRSFMHKAFQNAKRSATVLSEDSCNRRDHSQHGVQMLTSTPIGKLEMKKPSPPTPKSVALEWKVKNLNAMLESARSENITQERQIEQLLQNVKDLQEDKKRYRTKISVLQLKEMCSCTSDSAELPHTINRETEQLQKQLDMNNKLIETLQENISKAKESAKTATERYMAMQKQYAAVQEDNVRMKITIEDLKEELTLRDNMNQNLTEAVNDLRRFIRENHIRGAELMEPLNSSFEYLDKSFKNVTSDDSQCYDSENLASTVVDIKLKEKEHENEALTMKIQELEGNLQDMQRLQKEMLEQHTDRQTEANAKITDLLRSLAESEEHKKQLTHDHDKLNKEMEILICQLKSQKQSQFEERERLQAEMNEKIAEFQISSAEARQIQMKLADEIKQKQAEIQDLNRKLDIQLKLQAEMDEKTAEMRQALADAEKDKSQLAEDLKKGKAESEDLVCQLESLKKLQMEERLRFEAEMNKKTAEMQQTLAVAEKDKSQLADELNRLKSNESFTTALRTEMLEKVSTLQQSLEQEREKSEEINCQYLQAKKQADDLDAQCIKLMQKLSEDRTDISKLQSELTSKDAKLEELKALYDEKQKQFEKNYQDNEILSVKLYKARSALKEKEDAWAKSMQDCKKDMEEKLRDARIEFDSTMEKMKERMKELHKEVKTKLACDNQGLALTADGYRRKVENLEIRCAKLQKQLAEMNERNLDVRKENQHLHIKLKTLEEYGHDRKSLMLPTQASLRSNLRMEDEEGELFNNMYLADLKSGRCVSPGPTNGGLDRYSELSQRNSKLLPHLRTNYVALAPDCEPPHDDTRDNMSTTFDDSSTGLISRRKVSGITSYKRPGPPTPSKRAGRLSLNGALAMGNGGEIQYKDALRDANTDAATGGGGGVGTVAETTGSTRLGRTKTPGKFKQMISSSSLLNNFQRDEGYTAATLKASTRRVHNAANDYPPDMPSNGAIRLSAVAKRKCLQRKILFDSNRGLANGSTHCSQDSAANEASLPLRTILEYPTPKETSLEKGNACGNASPFDTLQSIAPMTPVTTAILPVTRTNTTLTDVTTVTTTTTTLATATNGHPVPHLAASDYSFTQPYGSNRYNILRMQLQRREKRRLLYDETRKVPAKGRNVLSSVSFGSPSVSVTARDVDNNNDMDSTGDITLYHSFTSDMDDSNKPTLNTACPNSTAADCTRTPLLLIILAYIGFLAQILFCFGNRPNSSRNR